MRNFDLRDFEVELQPSNLPPALEFAALDISPDPKHRNAYGLALALEALGSWPNSNPTFLNKWPDRKLTPRMAGRLLGYLLIEAPMVDGADAIALEILGSPDRPQYTGSLRDNIQ